MAPDSTVLGESAIQAVTTSTLLSPQYVESWCIGDEGRVVRVLGEEERGPAEQVGAEQVLDRIQHRLVADQAIKRPHQQVGPMAQPPATATAKVPLGGLDIGPDRARLRRRNRLDRKVEAVALVLGDGLGGKVLGHGPLSQTGGAATAVGPPSGANAASIARRVRTASAAVSSSSAVTSVPGQRRVRLHCARQLDAVSEADGQVAAGEARRRRHQPAVDRVAPFPVEPRAGLQSAPWCRPPHRPGSPVGAPVGSPRNATLATEMPSSSPIRW